MICKIVPQEALREAIAIPLGVLMESRGPDEYQQELARVSEHNILISQEMKVGDRGGSEIHFCFHHYTEGSAPYRVEDVEWAHIKVSHARRNFFYFIRSWVEAENLWRLDCITDAPGLLGLKLVKEVEPPC